MRGVNLWSVVYKVINQSLLQRAEFASGVSHFFLQKYITNKQAKTRTDNLIQLWLGGNKTFVTAFKALKRKHARNKYCVCVLRLKHDSFEIRDLLNRV